MTKNVICRTNLSDKTYEIIVSSFDLLDLTIEAGTISYKPIVVVKYSSGIASLDIFRKSLCANSKAIPQSGRKTLYFVLVLFTLPRIPLHHQSGSSSLCTINVCTKMISKTMYEKIIASHLIESALQK